MNERIIGWNVDAEREVAPGVYAKLVSNLHGWTLWRFENINGVTWSAGKSSRDDRPVAPLGVGQALWGGVPWLRLFFLKGHSVTASLHGSHLHDVRSEMRLVGQRFMTPVSASFDPLPYDGDKLEVIVRSMPGPKSFSKIAHDSGIIDMTGLSAIIELGNAGK